MVEIRLTNLTKRFGDVTAVDDVTLTIRPGELFFLLGPSGCGKTTLLRLIAGFLEADDGTIHFDDRPMERVPAHLRNTGMVFQNYALWPHMTVERNVRYGLDIRRVGRDEKHRRVREILALVHMADLAGRFPSQLSGGQQQRVALARALVVEPDVVLMDEPLSNLDAKLRLEMRAEIKRIHQRSPRTTVYVTHDQKEALSLADRIALMNDGRIIQVGTPEEVYTRPADLFCARFIAGANTLAGILRSAEGSIGSARSARDSAPSPRSPEKTPSSPSGPNSFDPHRRTTPTSSPPKSFHACTWARWCSTCSVPAGPNSSGPSSLRLRSAPTPGRAQSANTCA